MAASFYCSACGRSLSLARQAATGWVSPEGSAICGSWASRRLATLSLSLSGAWLCFARESVALRARFGNQRASNFGLRSKVTKERFWCDSRENLLLLARAIGRFVLPNLSAPAHLCKQHWLTESVHRNDQSVCCLFNTLKQCARARKSERPNS